MFVNFVTLLAIAASARGAPRSTSNGISGAGGLTDSIVSGSTPDFGLDSGSLEVTGSDGARVANFQQQQQQQRLFQTVIGKPFLDAAGVLTAARPQYEEHIRVNSGLRPVTTTITNTVTQTHTLRVPSTSDVWVTSVTMLKVPVTQLSTQRSYVPVAPNTVTSVIRITKTPIEVVTRTEEVYPTKTLVSVFTPFVTETETVELWQNIVHRATNYEVLTVPVVETQTLLQRLFSTITVTRVVNFTSVQQPILTQQVIPRSGELPAPATQLSARY